MKKISIMILVFVVALTSCKKTPEVNLKYVDVERDLITVGTTTATVQCDYQYIATLKKAFFYYGEGQDEADMSVAEMRVVQGTLYVELSGLKDNTDYGYYYEFMNGFNSMRSNMKTFKTEASPITPHEVTLPTVLTSMVTEITTNSAMGGGEVTNDGGAQVTECGICWGTNVNPTLSDNHVALGLELGSFMALMNSLEANATYYVRAYATNAVGTAYGLDRKFRALFDGGEDNHDYVDLGLPSGLLWAACNVGAKTPEEYGEYFAWGETQPKDIYNGLTYKFYTDFMLIKYCSDSCYGYNSFVDNLTTLLPEDDAATTNWGEDWHTATKEDWEELISNTTKTLMILNEVYGVLFTASNGNNIFLPITDSRADDGFNPDQGIYMSSSLHSDLPISYWGCVLSTLFTAQIGRVDGRPGGYSVRAVRSTH